MRIIVTSILVLAGLTTWAGANNKITKAEYVDAWASTAIAQMIEYKIPASITLAQGILESGSGNSDLAIKGNNHFGIKCHDWDGKKMYKDDDKKNECFRVYEDASESYQDHSLFLGKSRYASLFQLDIKDYKGWAKGLKEAGYATNPKYPQLLINIIEELDLTKFDEIGSKSELPLVKAERNKNKSNKNESVFSKSTASTSVVKSSTRTIHVNERKTKYVIAEKGDTYYRIAQETGLTLKQLYRYNDFEKNKDVLQPGDIIYIHPKKRRAKKEFAQYSNEKTLIQVAQEEGVKLKSLMKLNNTSSEVSVIEKGEKVTLR